MRRVHLFLLAMTFCLFTAHAATKNTKRSAVSVTDQVFRVVLVIGNQKYEAVKKCHGEPSLIKAGPILLSVSHLISALAVTLDRHQAAS